MGFKDWYKAQNERHKAHVAQTDSGIAGGYGLTTFLDSGTFVTVGVNKRVAGATAEYESGADQRRTTLTRVAGGAIIAGPAGAIVGGMFKKNESRGYVTVTFPDGDVAVIDGPIKDEKKLREFAIIVNRAGRHYAE